jgi:hypothetical protein
MNLGEIKQVGFIPPRRLPVVSGKNQTVTGTTSEMAQSTAIDVQFDSNTV